MKNTLYISLLSLALVTLIASCNENNIVVKNDAGQVVEHYSITEDSLIHGLLSKYYPDGSLKETSNYNRGVLEGERKIYFPNGNVEIEEFYVNDLLQGDYKTYYDDGTLLIMVPYENGVMKGLLKKYFPDGKLLEEVTFHNNQENGPFTEYYQNGHAEWKGQYLNGDNEFGLLLNYDSSGVLVKKMMCDSLAICRTIWTQKQGDIIPE